MEGEDQQAEPVISRDGERRFQNASAGRRYTVDQGDWTDSKPPVSVRIEGSHRTDRTKVGPRESQPGVNRRS